MWRLEFNLEAENKVILQREKQAAHDSRCAREDRITEKLWITGLQDNQSDNGTF